MADQLLTNREIARLRQQAERTKPDLEPRGDVPAEPVDVLEDNEFEFGLPSEKRARADRRNMRRKLEAGWRGLKAAVRGDSSFFAHFYRGTLIVIAAGMLGINQWGWCLLILGASLVLVAELSHSAVDTLARAIGDPEEPRLSTAREIAAAGVLVAAFGSGVVTIFVLSWKFFELLNWRF